MYNICNIAQPDIRIFNNFIGLYQIMELVWLVVDKINSTENFF